MRGSLYLYVQKEDISFNAINSDTPSLFHNRNFLGTKYQLNAESSILSLQPTREWLIWPKEFIN